MIEVELKLFGAFKQIGDGRSLKLELPEGARLEDLRGALRTQIRQSVNGLQDERLVQDSAFSDEDEILNDHSVIRSGAKLCVLPPVCGG